jgi:biopolymer transport protein ExbD
MQPSLTTVFGLKTQLKAPKVQLLGLPLLDLVCLALLCSLFFTRYVMLPGVQVDLPQSDLKMGQGDSFLSVLTIGHHDALYFEGGVHNLRSIEDALQQLVERSEDANPALLIKASADLKMELFLHLCNLAKKAGFVQVKVAANEPTMPALVPLDSLIAPTR